MAVQFQIWSIVKRILNKIYKNCSKDECAPGSIRFLNNAGINFTKLENDGIDPQKFAEILIASGLFNLSFWKM